MKQHNAFGPPPSARHWKGRLFTSPGYPARCFGHSATLPDARAVQTCIRTAHILSDVVLRGWFLACLSPEKCCRCLITDNSLNRYSLQPNLPPLAFASFAPSTFCAFLLRSWQPRLADSRSRSCAPQIMSELRPGQSLMRQSAPTIKKSRKDAQESTQLCRRWILATGTECA